MQQTRYLNLIFVVLIKTYCSTWKKKISRVYSANNYACLGFQHGCWKTAT